jgi:hypothetical protein
MDPYAAPKSEERDVVAAPAPYWIRTRWLYLGLVAFLSFVMFSASDALLPSFTLVTAGCGFAVGILITISPIEAILARRSSSSPWWWDIVFCCVIGTAVAGAAFADPVLMVIGLLSTLIMVSVLTLGTWIIEVRYRVRAYSKARGVVFVNEDDAL